MRLRFAIQPDRSTDFSTFASTFDDRQTLVDQVLAAAADAERALQVVPIGKDIGGAEGIGIGHNQPRAEFAITEDDRAETLAAIATVRQETVSASPSTSRLRAAGKQSRGWPARSLSGSAARLTPLPMSLRRQWARLPGSPSLGALPRGWPSKVT